MLALYEMGESMYETVLADSTTAIYAIASIICASLLFVIAKVWMSRREAAKAQLASIEAFSYEEKSNNVVTQSEEDVESSSK